MIFCWKVDLNVSILKNFSHWYFRAQIILLIFYKFIFLNFKFTVIWFRLLLDESNFIIKNYTNIYFVLLRKNVIFMTSFEYIKRHWEKFTRNFTQNLSSFNENNSMSFLEFLCKWRQHYENFTLLSIPRVPQNFLVRKCV